MNNKTGKISRKLMEEIPLPNGLLLEFWDESKRLVGDRWYVGVRAMVGVPIPEEIPEGISEEAFRAIKKELGETIYFQLLEERNFIPENEVEKLKENLKNIFLENSLSYLSHPDFSRKFFILKATEAHKNMLMGQEYFEKLIDGLRGPD